MRTRRSIPIVVGLDLSARRPAACMISPGWEVGAWEHPALLVESWPQTDPDLVPNAVTPKQREAFRRDRARRVAEQVVAFVGQKMVLRDPRLGAGGEVTGRVVPARVFVEDYAYSRDSTSVTQLAEVRGVVRQALWACLRLDLEPVTSSAARKLLLGKLPGEDQKAHVQGALWRAGAPIDFRLFRKYVDRDPGDERAGWWRDDECDAFAVANYGLSELGLTALSLA